MDNRKILHVDSSGNLPTYSEREKELMKIEMQTEQAMMLGYLESQGINLYSDNEKDKLITSDNELIHYHLPENEVFTVDFDNLTSIAEDLSEFNLDINTLIDSFKSLSIASNNITNVNELLELMRNNIRIESIEEVPEKPKLINKGKTYHDNMKNLRFLNKRK